ncbi:MAG: GNAT family N-acetyltransferase [Candidatus Dormibacteria bacterium]
MEEELREGSSSWALVHSLSRDLLGTICITVLPPDRALAWIGLLLVARPARRQSYGREVVNAVQAHLAATGCREVRVHVEPRDTAALGFWLALGYLETARGVDDAGREVLTLARELG